MFIPFREFHIQALLQQYEGQSFPLDLFIRNYLRENTAIGSKDRPYIVDAVYALTRWKILLDAVFQAEELEHPYVERWKFYQSEKMQEAMQRQDLPPDVRVSFPSYLFSKLQAFYGLEKAIDICLACNEPAPAFIRANALKTTREALLERLSKSYEVEAGKFSKHSIIFNKKVNYFTLPEFTEGLFEVQDEGSQILADLIEAKPGDLVLDFCAGSGGKSLAIAPSMQDLSGKLKGQLFLHDIRKHALVEAKKRLKRAGIQIAQFLPEGDKALSKLKGKIDWVLVDAPCSGSGTLRRNPDMKSRFGEGYVERLVGEQRSIFEKALSFVKPGGKIAYATCSLLAEENQSQIEHFLKIYPLKLLHEPFQSLPSKGGMDGFFGAVFQKN